MESASPGRVIKKDQRHAGLKESSSWGVGSLIGDLGWGYHLFRWVLSFVKVSDIWINFGHVHSRVWHKIRFWRIPHYEYTHNNIFFLYPPKNTKKCWSQKNQQWSRYLAQRERAGLISRQEATRWARFLIGVSDWIGIWCGWVPSGNLT